MSRKAAIAANRTRMPGTAREVDAWRRVFGPDVRVVHAVEGEIEVGQPTQPGRSMDPDQWLHYLRTGITPDGKGIQ